MAFAFIIAIGGIFTKLFKLPKFVDTAVSLLLSVLFLLCTALFIYFLSGFFYKGFTLILTVHLVVLYAALLLSACIDMWKPIHFVPHLVFWAFEIVAIVGTVLVDWRLWYLVHVAVIWVIATYWFHLFDGNAFHNGVYPKHAK